MQIAFKRSLSFLLLLILFTMGLPQMTNSQTDLPKRSDVEDKYKWNLKDIYLYRLKK